MTLTLLFLCGIVNFAMHRAMMESDAPLMVEARAGFQRVIGPYGSYVLEFTMLVAAMLMTDMDMTWALTAYIFYTAANGLGIYFLLNSKI